MFTLIQKIALGVLWMWWGAVTSWGLYRNLARGLERSGESCNHYPLPSLLEHAFFLCLAAAAAAVFITLGFWKVRPVRVLSFGLACLYLWPTISVVVGNEETGYAPCTHQGDEGLGLIAAVLALVLLFLVSLGFAAMMSAWLGRRPRSK